MEPPKHALGLYLPLRRHVYVRPSGLALCRHDVLLAYTATCPSRDTWCSCIAVNDDGTLGEPTRVAGSEDDSAGESVMQPVWGPDGTQLMGCHL